MQKIDVKREETLLFMLCLTFIGGYINAYTFITRGGAFVSMHTGNMARIGIALVGQDFAMFFSCLIPILGTLLGAIIAKLIKTILTKKSLYFWHITSLIAEGTALLAVAFIPSTIGSHNYVNLFLAIVTGYQLSNFRTYEGRPHNTTIETGNIRTLGEHIASFIEAPSFNMSLKAFRYATLLFSFPAGAFFGVLASQFFGIYSIVLCSVGMFVLAFWLKISRD